MPPTHATPLADPAADPVAAVAERRRARKSGATTPPTPGGPAAPVDGAAPTNVVVSRTLVASHLGAGGAPLPTGGVFTGQPLILEPLPATAVALEGDGNYVVAEFDAEESMLPPGCYTPVTRLLWQRGYRVRRDLYESVLAAHAAAVAAGAAGAAQPADLPPGAGQIPPGIIAAPATAPATVIVPSVSGAPAVP